MENSNLSELMEEELKNRFNKPWIKLDKGSKLNRIHLYIKKEKIKNKLNDKQEIKLKELLFKLIESNCLSKNSEIEYSETEAEILNIKELKYNNDTKLYSYSVKKQKKPEVSRSKSNIDRHFNKSKENKKKK